MDSVKEKLVELLDDIQVSGEDFTDYEIYGMRLPDTISNEDVASRLIARGVTVQEWISVKDRLPFAEYGETDDVLVITELGVMRTLYFDGGNWCFQNGECCPHKVTHWMPLPPMPKGEKR